MKKLIIILIAAFSLSAASAQSMNDNYNKQDRYQVNQTRDNRYNSQQNRSNDYSYSNQSRNDDRRRQVDYDRMNQQYDQKINGYRSERSMSNFVRDRRINQVEQERQQRSGSFGSGVAIGGIAGLLLGVLIGH